MAYSEELQNRQNNFAIQYLKRSGDILDRSIHWWHLADEIWPSGSFASGVFDAIRLDGPTTPGYVWTATTIDGWGAWMPSARDHSLLTNLTWSTAGHIINSDILPNLANQYDLGSPALPFADIYGNGSYLTGVNFLQLTDTPNSYHNWAGSGVRVNATETGLEFCPIGGGGGGGTTILGAGYSVAFTNANLVAGVLTVSHNLIYKWNIVQVFDNNDVEVIPDSVNLLDLNTLTVNLSSFSPITGTWHVVVACGGGPNSYAGGYSHTQSIPSTEWIVVHDLGTEDVVVQVVDSSTPNKVLEPQEIEIIDNDTVHVVFPSGVTGKARVICTNAVGVSQYGTHDQLSNLEWSVAGHTIDTDILPTASGSASLGSAALPFASGYFNDVYVKEDSLHIGNNTSISAPDGKMTFKDVEVPSVTLKGLRIPTGGTTGQVLVKSSNSDYDVSWADPGGGGLTGTAFGTREDHEGICDGWNGGTAATDLLVYGWINGNIMLHVVVNGNLVIHIDPYHIAAPNPIPMFAVKKGQTWSMTWDHTPGYVYIMPVGT